MSAAALDTQDPYQGLSSEGLPEALRLGEPVTDATHAEFLQLLDAAARADDAGFLDAYGRVDRPYAPSFRAGGTVDGGDGFRPAPLRHAGEHQQVLAVAQAVRSKVAEEGVVSLGAAARG